MRCGPAGMVRVACMCARCLGFRTARGAGRCRVHRRHQHARVARPPGLSAVVRGKPAASGSCHMSPVHAPVGRRRTPLTANVVPPCTGTCLHLLHPCLCPAQRANLIASSKLTKLPMVFLTDDFDVVGGAARNAARAWACSSLARLLQGIPWLAHTPNRACTFHRPPACRLCPMRASPMARCWPTRLPSRRYALHAGQGQLGMARRCSALHHRQGRVWSHPSPHAGRSPTNSCLTRPNPLHSCSCMPRVCAASAPTRTLWWARPPPSTLMPR